MIKTIKFPFGLRTAEITGGPYAQRPKEMFGVNMAAEITTPSDVKVYTKDFSVPDEKQLLKALRKGLLAMALGRDVYVGCMGGIGRTGLYLAAMAKVLGVEDPIIYVRAKYLEHAVETTEQMVYITGLDVSSLKLTALQAKITRALLFWR